MSDTHRRHVLWTLNIATENGEYRWESTVYREHQQGERCTSDMMHCEHQAICTVHITPYEPYTVNIEQVNHEHQHDERCTSTTEHCEHQRGERWTSFQGHRRIERFCIYVSAVFVDSVSWTLFFVVFTFSYLAMEIVFCSRCSRLKLNSRGLYILAFHQQQDSRIVLSSVTPFHCIF